MSVSAIFGTGLATPPALAAGVRRVKLPELTGGGRVGVIEGSSRPQKKATAHHMKTRPRKTQQWDIKRRPTAYAPLPPLPPDWTVVSPAASDEVVEVTLVSAPGPESG